MLLFSGDERRKRENETEAICFFSWKELTGICLNWAHKEAILAIYIPLCCALLLRGWAGMEGSLHMNMGRHPAPQRYFVLTPAEHGAWPPYGLMNLS